MPDLPYPLISPDVEEWRNQILDMFRDIYENRVGGASIGDVFEVSGEVLQLKLKDGCGLKKTGGELDIDVDEIGSSGAILKATYTAKGDIITGKAAGDIEVKHVGANTSVLKASSTSDGGVEWANVTKEEVTGLTTSDSPTFTTAKLTGLTDGYIPKHTSDTVGLQNSPLYTDGTNIGVGTTSPGATVDVATASGASFRGINNGTSGAATAGGQINLLEDDGEAVGSGDRLGGVYFGGAKDNAHTYTNSAALIGYAEELFTSTQFGSKLSFETTAIGTGTRSGKMVILGSGNVGIGTAAPEGKLCINGGLHVGGDTDAGDNNLLVDGTLTVTGVTTLTTDLAITEGGTGASTAADAFSNLKQSASETATGVVELATNAETVAFSDTGRVVTPDDLGYVTQKSYNHVNYAKGELIDRIMALGTLGLVTSVASIKGLWLFDQTGATSAITDRSGNSHNLTLRDASLNAINASTCSPGVLGLAPYLTFDTTHLWNTDDSDDFSFAEPAVFSIVYLGVPTATRSTIAGKLDRTTGSEQREWVLRWEFSGANKLGMDCWDNSTASKYISRYENAATTFSNLETYVCTKDGGGASTGIKIYRNAALVSNASSDTGSYVALENTTAKLASYVIATDGTKDYQYKGKICLLAIIAEELTTAQITNWDRLLRSYAGVSL